MSDVTITADGPVADGTVVLDSGGYAWQFDGIRWHLASPDSGGGRRHGEEFVDGFGPFRVLYVPEGEDL